MLFDIGIAGPIAGFLVAVPALFIGRRHVARRGGAARLRRPESRASRCSSRSAANLIWGAVPDGYSMNMHPMAFAAWFGLLATALEPVSRRAAGRRPHLVRRARTPVFMYVTLAMLAAAVGADRTSRSAGWVWTVLMIVMLLHLRTAAPATYRRRRTPRPRALFWRSSRSRCSCSASRQRRSRRSTFSDDTSGQGSRTSHLGLTGR